MTPTERGRTSAGWFFVLVSVVLVVLMGLADGNVLRTVMWLAGEAFLVGLVYLVEGLLRGGDTDDS